MERDKMRQYIPGDLIPLRVTFAHTWHLDRSRIRAALVYAGEGQTNWERCAMEVVEWSTEPGTGGRLLTTLKLQSEEPVPPGVHPGGEYKLSSLRVASYGGQEFDLLTSTPGLESVRIWVRSGEPQDPPSVVDLAFE